MCRVRRGDNNNNVWRPIDHRTVSHGTSGTFTRTDSTICKLDSKSTKFDRIIASCALCKTTSERENRYRRGEISTVDE